GIQGGANLINQYLAAGLIDDFQIHLVPVLLGGGTRLFDGGSAPGRLELKPLRVTTSPSGVTEPPLCRGVLSLFARTNPRSVAGFSPCLQRRCAKRGQLEAGRAQLGV